MTTKLKKKFLTKKYFLANGFTRLKMKGYALFCSIFLALPSFAQSVQLSDEDKCQLSRNVIDAIGPDGTVSEIDVAISSAEIVASCNKILIDSASEQRPLFELALAYILDQQYDQARATLSELLILDPFDHTSYFLRAAIAYSGDGDPVSALSDVELAIRVAKDLNMRNPNVYPKPIGNYYLLKAALEMKIILNSGLRNASKKWQLDRLSNFLQELKRNSKEQSSVEFIEGISTLEAKVDSAIAALDP
ncbi:hypothetical protein [Neogemmobacter tilapiae]|uniref:Tetratricopeptide repeat protein n=1 Tax=Neogemmobacter tilapiae TaxID=875041 RepID=A0A918TX35_9RHOB|nr:hypothetical protein [Gemmobacter tilapiae]GHC66940.1 hypothetical protein GCM10007315_34810 [Gemmobacter tilapiae]